MSIRHRTRAAAIPGGATLPWPNLFVVGAAKAATTSLWYYLDRHPDVYMSPVKEPHFFSGYTPVSGDPPVHDEAAYLQLFANGAQHRVRGEASPSYLRHPEVPAAIRRVAPDAGIVIVLREPVDRAYSSFLYARRLGFEPRSFLDAVRAELSAPFDPTRFPSHVARSLYAEDVARWLAEFGESVLVLLFDDLATDPRSQVRAVFELTDVDPDVADAIDPEHRNAFTRPRNGPSGRLVASARARSLGRAIVPSRFRPRIESMLLVRAPKPELDQAARQLLEELFRPDVARLEEILGRRLPWTTARSVS